MFIPDIRSVELLLGSFAVIAVVSPVQAAEHYALGVCRTARQSTGEEIMPTFDADIYLTDYHAGDARYKDFSFATKGGNVSLVKAPAHGKISLSGDVNAASESYYHYLPNQGYIGRDRFVLLVEKDSVKVRIEYLIEGLDNDETDVGICDKEHWKISAITSTFDNASLQARLNAVGGNHIFPFITNAVDLGWYIDYTPYLNKALQPSRILQSALQPKQA